MFSNSVLTLSWFQNMQRMNTLFILSLTLMVVIMSSGSLFAEGKCDSLVIKLDNIEVSQCELEHRFNFAMVVRAIQAGAPIKDQARIEGLRHQFLEQRLNEMILLQEAANRNMAVSDVQVENSLLEFVENMGWADNLEEYLELIGLQDRTELTEIIRERELVSRMLAEIEKEISVEGINKSGLKLAVQTRIAEYREKYQVELYPENLTRSGIRVSR